MSALASSERFRALRLGAMADCWQRQEASLDPRSAAERVAELLDAQEAAKADSALKCGHRRAAVSVSSARLEDVRYVRGRGLTPPIVDALKSWEWVRAKKNLIITGETGRGKTWLSSAIANEALRAKFKVRWFDVRGFLQQWYDEESQGMLGKFFAEVSRADVLVLDRWAAQPIDAHGVARLEDLVSAREAVASLVVCSTAPPEDWVAWLGGGAAAKGIVDRLMSRANRIELKGASQR